MSGEIHLDGSNNLVIASHLKTQPHLLATTLTSDPALKAEITSHYPQLVDAAERYMHGYTTPLLAMLPPLPPSSDLDQVKIDAGTGNLFIPPSLLSNPSLLVSHCLTSPALSSNLNSELREAMQAHQDGKPDALLALLKCPETLERDILANVTNDLTVANDLGGGVINVNSYGPKSYIQLVLDGGELLTAQVDTGCNCTILSIEYLTEAAPRLLDHLDTRVKGSW